MRDFLTKPITAADEAKAYIKRLFDEGMLYHFDDSAESIIWDGVEVSAEECKLLNARCDELFGFDFCPFGEALKVMGVKETD